MNIQRSLEQCPLSLSFDLRPLHAYLGTAAEFVEGCLSAPQLGRLATGEHLAHQQFMPVLHELRAELWRTMLDAFSESEFRATSLLFRLHADCLVEQLPVNSVERFVLRWMAGWWLDPPLRGEPYDARCRFSASDLCAYNLHPLVLTMAGGRPHDWIRHIIMDDDFDQHVWRQIGREEGKPLLLPLCRQIATMRICLDRHGQFAPQETRETARHPLCPEQLPERWHKLFRGFLVLALQHEWLTISEAKAIMARNPKLEPCWLLTFSSDEACGFPGHLPEFAHDLRRRFPAMLDQHPHERNPLKHELDLFFGDFKSWHGKSLSGWLDLRGSECLMAAARYSQSHPGMLADNPTMRRIAHATVLDSRETPQDVIQQLERFPVKTLLELLPWAGAAQPWLLQAMNMTALARLLHWMQDCAKPDQYGDPRMAGPHLVNDPDASKDVFDVAGFHAALAGTKPAEVKMLISAFIKAGMMGGLDKVHAALTGAADRERLWEAAVQKEQQPAMKLLGLLPVDGANDVRNRYLALQSLYKRAAGYGSQRQATQRAAAQCGLANLARTAGYLDGAELEWEIEVADGAELTGAMQPKQVDAYVVQLERAGFSVTVSVRNDAGKLLKSMPPAIKRQPAVIALTRVAVDTRDQIRRFSRLMEVRMMREMGVPIAALRIAMAHPVAAGFVATLVWHDEAGSCGLLDEACLVGPEGSVPAVGDRLWVVHPVRLLERRGVAGLATWQRWLVSRAVVQPFKQLFREIYHPTVAELDLADTSLRYTGRRINSRIAQGLLQSRGWVPPGALADGAFRCCYGESLWAKCALGFGHYLTEESETTIGELWFERDGQRLRLTDVAAPVFSEAMRDIDLVSAVAISSADEEGTQLSAATVVARRVLLSAVLPTLRKDALELRERHALIHGQLANYRIDLASCRIYFDPGGHLCLIPEALLAREEVLLPYAEEDMKTADLLRKAMLLMNDGKIKAPEFLRQVALNGR